MMREIDRWLRREGSWLANGLHRISSEKGSPYRLSQTKRTIDVAIGLPMTILTSPLTGLLFIASSLQEPVGHPFYKQERRKSPTETINITKFRTMKPDSDRNPDLALELSASFKPENDPRDTKLGRILRVFEFDELPQLFEVLIGKLSLVDIRSMAPPDFKFVEKHLPSVYLK
jgi:lipopolysaccharide/colanic/teichoic acid biosynthesis glycosyltransferase